MTRAGSREVSEKEARDRNEKQLVQIARECLNVNVDNLKRLCTFELNMLDLLEDQNKRDLIIDLQTIFDHMNECAKNYDNVKLSIHFIGTAEND